MSEPFQLVTNCTFKGKDYLVQMCVLNSKKLELIVTDKLMAEDWQCEYDASYIESLTHKTGNFKQFDVFVTMLKSGLLKTSDCISLDLLSLEDLEELRSKKLTSAHSSSRTNQSSNKRYLILTYSVEFDRILYPLALDYCGPPNPSILQSNIRRLEAEVERLKQKNISLSKNETEDTKKLKAQVQEIKRENMYLTSEVRRLNKELGKQKNPLKNAQILQNNLKKLEDKVMYERNINIQSIAKLKAENKQLTTQIEELKKKERQLTQKLRESLRNNSTRNVRRPLRNYLSPENSFEKKKKLTEEHSESVSLRQPLNCNRPKITKQLKLQPKKKRNRFLSSSNSESGADQPHRARCRERIQPSLKTKGRCRKSSYEKSERSSEDSLGKIQPQNSACHRKAGSSLDGEKKSRSSSSHKERVTSKSSRDHSRESSLSSRSSRKSKVSNMSNLGCGDHKAIKSNRTSKSVLSSKEEIKFTMSDLETRILALHKLLSEGLSF